MPCDFSVPYRKIFAFFIFLSLSIHAEPVVPFDLKDISDPLNQNVVFISGHYKFPIIVLGTTKDGKIVAIVRETFYKSMEKGGAEVFNLLNFDAKQLGIITAPDISDWNFPRPKNIDDIFSKASIEFYKNESGKKILHPSKKTIRAALGDLSNQTNERKFELLATFLSKFIYENLPTDVTPFEKLLAWKQPFEDKTPDKLKKLVSAFDRIPDLEDKKETLRRINSLLLTVKKNELGPETIEKAITILEANAILDIDSATNLLRLGYQKETALAKLLSTLGDPQAKPEDLSKALFSLEQAPELLGTRPFLDRVKSLFNHSNQTIGKKAQTLIKGHFDKIKEPKQYIIDLVEACLKHVK